MRYLLPLAVLLIVAGCSSKTGSESGGDVVYQNRDGKLTQNRDGSATIETKGGTADLNVGISESDLGGKFYPGSKEEQGGTKMDTPEGKMVMAVRSTADPADRVLAFYTAELGKPTGQYSAGGATSATWTKDKDTFALNLTTDNGVTKMTFTRVTKTK